MKQNESAMQRIIPLEFPVCLPPYTDDIWKQHKQAKQEVRLRASEKRACFRYLTIFLSTKHWATLSIAMQDTEQRKQLYWLPTYLDHTHLDMIVQKFMFCLYRNDFIILLFFPFLFKVSTIRLTRSIPYYIKSQIHSQ